MELQETLQLHVWRWPGLGSGGHLRHLQRPVLDSPLGGSARVLGLTHQTELFLYI